MKNVIVIENEVYSRVVGYYRPISSFNVGKEAEFKSRSMLTFKTDYDKKINNTPLPIITEEVQGEYNELQK